MRCSRATQWLPFLFSWFALWLVTGCHSPRASERYRQSTVQVHNSKSFTNSVAGSPTNSIVVVVGSGSAARPTVGQKWNPKWWFGNIDDPTPPDWYRPGDPHRLAMWHRRNPLHNFMFYVVGVADKDFVRTGRYPENVFNPNGGFNWSVCKYKWWRLPFISYSHGSFKMYLGWRERGDFGAKLTF